MMATPGMKKPLPALRCRTGVTGQSPKVNGVRRNGNLMVLPKNGTIIHPCQ